jgi:nitrate reductase cytochrome c-type subunit
MNEQLRQLRWAGGLLAALVLSFGAASAQSAERQSARLPRAYQGAPPLIPHDVEARKGACLTCHESGLAEAPIVPHPTRSFSCLQCHVGQDHSAKPFVSGSAPAK